MNDISHYLRTVPNFTLPHAYRMYLDIVFGIGLTCSFLKFSVLLQKPTCNTLHKGAIHKLRRPVFGLFEPPSPI